MTVGIQITCPTTREYENMEIECHLTEIELRFSYLLINKNESWKNYEIMKELPILLSYVRLTKENRNNLLIMLTNPIWKEIEVPTMLEKKRQMLLETIITKSFLKEAFMVGNRTIEEQMNSLNYFVACLIIFEYENRKDKKNLLQYVAYFLSKVDRYIYEKLLNKEYDTVGKMMKVQIYHIISHDVWEELESEYMSNVIKKLRKFYKLIK